MKVKEMMNKISLSLILLQCPLKQQLPNTVKSELLTSCLLGDVECSCSAQAAIRYQLPYVVFGLYIL